MNNKRTFEGKVYLLADSGFPNRMKAKAAARELRKEGYLVRIAPGPGTHSYSLYRRHRTRFI